MGKASVWCAMLAVCLSWGCGPGDLSLARHQQMVASLNEAADILATVTDEETAKAARPRLVEVGERIRGLYDAARIGRDTARDLQNLKYDAKLVQEQEEVTAARDRYGKEAARVSDIPGGVNLVRTFSVYLYPSSVR